MSFLNYELGFAEASFFAPRQTLLMKKLTPCEFRLNKARQAEARFIIIYLKQQVIWISVLSEIFTAAR